MATENKHDFSGQCSPASEGFRMSYETFSVGIFQWVKKSGGNGLKKTKAKVRVVGSTETPEKVFERAKEICALLDSGNYKGTKTVKVAP